MALLLEGEFERGCKGVYCVGVYGGTLHVILTNEKSTCAPHLG